ncbi:MAG: glycosyltransferase family 2 protein [Planctomycetia bacterium]|nr:glycosyltransferase family 2 protein [Planctomycetia bacterium]
MAMHSPSIWIIVPAYQEAARLGNTLHTLMQSYRQVVVIDDGSADATSQVAHDAGAWVVRHPINCGQGAALQTGITFALQQGADYLVTFDADGQHDPTEIPRLLEPLQTGQADVALGSRFLGNTVNMPWTRRFILKAGVLFTRIVSQMRVTDTHNGFRALTRQAALKINLLQDRMAHASEILDQIRRHRLRYVEVPVTIRYTADTLAKGQSSLHAVKIAGELLLGRMIK